MIDVARLAGVSAQTVSRVLSDHPNVSTTVRAKVLAAVDQLGYRRNNAARMLSSGRSRTLGVVQLQSPYYSRNAIAVGIETAANLSGYAVTTSTTPSLDPVDVERALLRLADQDVEGIVLAIPLIAATNTITEITRAIPTITIDGSRTSATEVVAIDQARAAELATAHLLELGHDTVWHISGPTEWLDSVSRREGWRNTLEREGRQVPPPLAGDWSPRSGYENGLVLGRIPEVTAVFVASDEMAFGLIRALHELGRRIPEDLSVVGVDNVALAEFCTPPLTTVAQPFADMGALAVAHVLQHIEHPEMTREPQAVQPELIVRASSGPAPI